MVCCRTWSPPMTNTAGAVLGQVAVATKRDKIPAVRDLLACFDLTGAVITVDVMHAHNDAATIIPAVSGN